MNSKILVSALYYKASCEGFKWPWQAGFISDQIAKHAHGSFSHEELLFHKDVIKAAIGEGQWDGFLNDDQCFSSSSRDGGCRFKSAALVLKHPERWRIIPVTRDPSKALTMLQFCKAQDGKKYDFRGVISFLLPKMSENPNKWYCSEVCDRAKRIVGLWPSFYRSHPTDSYWIQLYLSKCAGFKQTEK